MYTIDFETAKFVTGIPATICTTIAFIPQIVKIRRSGGRDLSYPMLLLYLAGVSLWLVYGIVIHASIIIAANGVAICLVAACLALKWKYEREAPATDSNSL